MVIDKKEIQAQVEWALRSVYPLHRIQLEEIKAKWLPVGMEIEFNGGYALQANFEGRELAMAWQSMGEVERYTFAKDCEDLLCRQVTELGMIDHGYLCSLFHLLKQNEAEKRILFGDGIQFQDMLDLVGTNVGMYYDLSNLGDGIWAMVGNHRNAELRVRAFMDSLEFHVKPIHR